MCGQLSTTCSNAKEVAQWATPSRPQPATDNDVRADDPIDWPLSSKLTEQCTELEYSQMLLDTLNNLSKFKSVNENFVLDEVWN